MEKLYPCCLHIWNYSFFYQCGQPQICNAHPGSDHFSYILIALSRFVMPLPLGAGGIMFSGCPSGHPSLRPQPEIASFHQYMSPLVHPTNRDRFAACLSVRRGFQAFARKRMENGLKFCMLMYLDHLQKWLVYGHDLLIFQIFDTILTSWNGLNLGFPGISQRTHVGNGLKFCMLIYLDHLQNWLIYGHGLLIFLIFALFRLSEMGQIWGFGAFLGELMEGMTCNSACCSVLVTSRTD